MNEGSNGKERGIIYALAIGIPALIGFHEYSTYLSSPWTTGKLMEPQDQAAFWSLFWEATAASFIWSAAVTLPLALGIHDWRPMLFALLSVGGVAAWLWYDYSREIARGGGSTSG